MNIDLLVTTESGPVVAGTLSLSGSVLTHKAQPGYELLVQNVLNRENLLPPMGEESVTKEGSLDQWFNALPFNLNGSYLRAEKQVQKSVGFLEDFFEKGNSCHIPSGPKGGQFCSAGSPAAGGNYKDGSPKAKVLNLLSDGQIHSLDEIRGVAGIQSVKHLLLGMDDDGVKLVQSGKDGWRINRTGNFAKLTTVKAGEAVQPREVKQKPKAPEAPKAPPSAPKAATWEEHPLYGKFHLVGSPERQAEAKAMLMDLDKHAPALVSKLSSLIASQPGNVPGNPPIFSFIVHNDRVISRPGGMKALGLHSPNRFTVEVTNQRSGSWSHPDFSLSSMAKTPQDSIRNTLIHELSHHVDHRLRAANYREYIDRIETPINRHLYGRDVPAHAVKGPTVSQYARTNAAEYFAESSTAYFVNPTRLRQMDSHGFDLMESIYAR